jgi:hypothetical protein
MSFESDTMTNIVCLTVTDFAEEDDLEDSKLLWEQNIHDLVRLLGAELT